MRCSERMDMVIALLMGQEFHEVQCTRRMRAHQRRASTVDEIIRQVQEKAAGQVMDKMSIFTKTRDPNDSDVKDFVEFHEVQFTRRMRAHQRSSTKCSVPEECGPIRGEIEYRLTGEVEKKLNEKFMAQWKHMEARMDLCESQAGVDAFKQVEEYPTL
ncbi:hypothetical protein RHGRI_029812 [Rhododendron griersonianum]|uniref:Uncharacterized protein n=1 Tax=Rhododendron griersonianum TaxID=479676 RepID=A0AAV6IKR7_9ERIC|nr:hypothetical protein RHGRI_029812 [Rhododendron griersonianum]